MSVLCCIIFTEGNDFWDEYFGMLNIFSIVDGCIFMRKSNSLMEKYVIWNNVFELFV